MADVTEGWLEPRLDFFFSPQICIAYEAGYVLKFELCRIVILALGTACIDRFDAREALKILEKRQL